MQLRNVNAEEIKKGKSIMGMFKNYSLVSIPILPANACRITAKSLLLNQPFNFSYQTYVFNNTEDLSKYCSIRNDGCFNTLNRMILCYVMHECIQQKL